MTCWCNICGRTGGFLLADAGREGAICPNCGASARSRALVYAVGMALGAGPAPLPEWPRRTTHAVLEASGRGLYPALLAERFCYANTEYAPNRNGGHRPFEASADLEDLAYPDGSLDMVIAGDVFEHVRDDGRALQEVHRVLRPGGLAVLTVPVDQNRAETLVRVMEVDGVEQHLEPPEYHGGGGRGLAYRTYGRDLPERLRAAGFATGRWTIRLPEIGVQEQEVWVCAKGAALDLTPFSLPPAQPSQPLSPLLPFRLWVFAKYNFLAARRVAADLQARFR